MYRLDISQVATRSGFAPSTLRYYEKRGLIASDGRHGLRRQYDDSVLTRLGFIALGQRAGFSLDQIAHFLSRENGDLQLNREDLRNQADQLRQHAKELQATASLLDHIAQCSAPSHLECPRFNTLLQDALSTRSTGPD